MDEGDAGLQSVAVDDEAGLEVVQAVHDQGGVGHQPGDTVGGDASRQGDHPDAGVEATQALLGRFGLGLSEVRLAVEDLAIQVGKLHPAGVADPQRPDPGRREVGRHGAFHPPPPAPATNTVAEARRAWASSPHSGRRICRW
jgi:hypothetical protein